MKKGALLIGYARISKADDQDTAAQVKALRQTGCERIFEEKASGGRWNKALNRLRHLWRRRGAARGKGPLSPLLQLKLVFYHRAQPYTRDAAIRPNKPDRLRAEFALVSLV